MAATEEQRVKSLKQSTIFISVLITVVLVYLLMNAMSLATENGVNIPDGIALAFGNMAAYHLGFPINSGTLTGAFLGLLVGGFISMMMLYDNERNYSYKKGAEAGTSRFMTEKELKAYNEKYIKSDPPAIKKNLPIAYIPEKDKSMYSANIIMSDKFCRPLNSRKIIGNNNVLVVGGAGTGKSRFYIKPNVLQMNASYIITDPSGEMIKSLGKTLSEHGYKIKIFNISDMVHSNCYNPMRYVRDEAGVNMLIECLINNTTKGEGGGDNQFFVDAEKLLYSACIYYLINHCHDESKRNFSSVMNMINASSVNEMDPNAKSDLDKLFDELPRNSLAWKNYKAFKQAAGKTLKSIIISCVVRLRPFMTPQVINLTKTDNIELEAIGNEKTALFIITPQADRTYAFLASMLYSQLFETLYHVGEQQLANGGSEQMKIPVRCLMDEFANIGEVPEFPSKLSTMRKYNISATIVLQDIAQIEAMYEDNWKTLVGNCSTIIFLGTQEPNTLKYFSELLGDSTIRTKSSGESKGKSGSSSKNFQQTARPVMTPDELGRMPASECIVFTQNMFAVRDKKYRYERHPYYSETSDANPDNAFRYSEIVIYDNSKQGDLKDLIKVHAQAAKLRDIRTKSTQRPRATHAKLDDIKSADSTAKEMSKISLGAEKEKIAFESWVNECIFCCLNETTKISIGKVMNVPPQKLLLAVQRVIPLVCKDAVVIFSDVSKSDKEILGVAVSADKNTDALYDFLNVEGYGIILKEKDCFLIVLNRNQYDAYKQILIEKQKKG